MLPALLAAKGKSTIVVPIDDWEPVPGYALTAANWSVLRNLPAASAVFSGSNEVTLTATPDVTLGDVMITAKRRWLEGDFMLRAQVNVLQASGNAGNKILGLHAFLEGDGSTTGGSTPSYAAALDDLRDTAVPAHATRYSPGFKAASYTNYTTFVSDPQYWGGAPCLWRHGGLDISGAVGIAVKCLMDGTIRDIDNTAEAKTNRIVVEGDDGVCWIYGHLQRATGLLTGQRILAGATIGTISASADSAWAPHLHLGTAKVNFWLDNTAAWANSTGKETGWGVARGRNAAEAEATADKYFWDPVVIRQNMLTTGSGPSYPADVSKWPADSQGITTTPINSDTVADHCRGIAHFFLQCVDAGETPGKAHRMRLLDFDANTPVVAGWTPDEAYAEVKATPYFVEVIRRGSEWSYKIATSPVGAPLHSAKINLGGIDLYDDGWFAFRLWDGNQVKLTTLELFRYTGSSPGPTGQYGLENNWKVNYVRHSGNVAKTPIAQTALGVVMSTAFTNTVPADENLAVVSLAQVMSNWRYTLKLTSKGEMALPGLNGAFCRLYFMKGTKKPSNVASWDNPTNGETLAIPGTDYYCLNGRGGLITFCPHQPDDPDDNSDDRIRVSSFEESSNLTRFANSADPGVDLKFPSPIGVQITFVIERIGTKLTLTWEGVGVPKRTWVIDDLEVSDKFGGNVILTVSRRQMDFEGLVYEDLSSVVPVAKLVPDKFVSPHLSPIYVDNNAQLDTEIAKLNSVDGGEIICRGPIGSCNIKGRKFNPTKPLVLTGLYGTGTTKLSNMQKLTGTLDTTGSSGIVVRQFQMATVMRPWGEDLRITECYLNGSPAGTSFNWNNPTSPSRRIMMDRITVDRTYPANTGYTSWETHWLADMWWGETSPNFNKGWLQDLTFARWHIKKHLNSKGPIFTLGRNEGSNGVDGNFRFIECLIPNGCHNAKQFIHGKWGGLKLIRNVIAEYDQAENYYNRHGVDNWLIGNIFDGSTYTIADYDTRILNNRGMNGGRIIAYTGGPSDPRLPASYLALVGNWPKGQFPGGYDIPGTSTTVSCFPRNIRPIFAGNRDMIYSFDQSYDDKTDTAHYRPFGTVDGEIYDSLNCSIITHSVKTKLKVNTPTAPAPPDIQALYVPTVSYLTPAEVGYDAP